MFIIGMYFTLYLGVKLFTGGKKEVPAVAVSAHAHSAGSDEIPSVDSPSFAEWIAGPGNVEKFIGSIN
jgi:hypothetical protein